MRDISLIILKSFTETPLLELTTIFEHLLNKKDFPGQLKQLTIYTKQFTDQSVYYHKCQ